MNKIIISSLLLASSFTLASAEQTQKPAPTVAKPIKAEFAKSTKGMMASGTTMHKEMGDKRPPMGTGTPMMGEVREKGEQMGMSSTGDLVLDEKIHSLKKEMDDKIQAIRVEYEGKLKTLVGDKKPQWASSTQMRGDMYEKMKNGSGTPMQGDRPMGDRQMEGKRPPMGTGTPMMKMENRKPSVSGPTGMIKNFFQSMFGGNPVEAQAEEVR